MKNTFLFTALRRRKAAVSMTLVLLAVLLAGCGGDSADKNNSPPSETASASTQGSETAVGTRDSTPQVLVPQMDPAATFGNDLVQVNASYSQDGYIQVDYVGTNDNVKMQITTPENVVYTYTLHDPGSFETFPLTGGDGTYTVKVFEHVQDTQYSTAYTTSIDVTLASEFSPYLYPNQYVNFSPGDAAVAKGQELALSANTDLDVVTNVYNYIIKNISYDQEKADTVKSGYLPVPDETLKTGKGICFDYAALMATMLRTQRIPTRLEIGYSGTAYHAWVSVYITDVGWLDDIIKFDGHDWELVDPTLGANNSSEDRIRSYIGDGSNYETQYVY